MRILAIRGENLASLARPFELDLTKEPLAGAGLFAITGETGSGKSTILDALCLALYGEYPRVAVGRQESAPDPSGKEISISDGRAILRRGASEGFAEVDFLGHDGVGYRVRWSVARARGKANGRLQNARRSLRRLADDSAVAEGIIAVLKEVEMRTDLTFEQFRRTVLLAQGDFDAFLLSEERDRADLLEKITGTEIYGSISIQVRQGTDQLRREMGALEQRRLDIGLLDADTRATLEEAQIALTQTIEEQEIERGRISAELEKRRSIASAQENLRLANEQLCTAQQQRESAQDEFTLLAELDEVESLRGLHIVAKDAAEALPGAEQKVKEAAISLDRASEIARGAETQLAEAKTGVQEAEAIFKKFGPVWTEAERLDAQVASAREEHQKAEQEVDKAKKTVQAQQTALEDLQGKLTAAISEQQKAILQLEEQNCNSVLAERLDEVLAQLQEYEEKTNANRSATLKVSRAKATVANLKDDVAKAEVRIRAADKLRKELTLQGNAFHAQLNDLNEGELQGTEAGLAKLVVDLREAHRLAGRAGEAARNLIEAERKLEQALAEKEQAQVDVKTAQTQMDRDTGLRARLVPLDDLAQQSVSSQAAHLRSFVLPGEACPVCGATEHPYSDTTDEGDPGNALAILAESLRNQRRELDASLARTSGVITTASAQHAGATARENEASRNAAAAKLEVAKAVAEFNELRPAIAEAAATFELKSSLPTTLESQTQDELAVLGREAAGSLKLAKESLANVKQIRSQMDAVRQDGTRAQTQFESEEAVKQERIAALHAAELILQQNNAALDQIVVTIQTIERELTPFLIGAKLSLDNLQQNVPAARIILQREAISYRDLKERVGSLENTVYELKPKCAEADAVSKSKKEQLAECSAALEQRFGILREKLNERAALLDGETTATHRTRFNDLRTAAIAAQTAASTAQSEAASAHRGSVVEHEQAVAGNALVRTRAAETHNVFNEACTASGRALEWVLERLMMSGANRAETRTRLQGIERSLNISRANVATRTKDLEAARAGVDESIDVQVLAALLNTLGEEIRVLQQRFGESAAELKRDKQAQDDARALSVEIDAKREQLTVWQGVDDAIGSPDGSRFRKFVQSITLEHLTRLANDHLNALGPRYQLVQGITSDLAVHVVDRDMADELRAARSLSGGERFLVSLSLALALSGLEGRSSFVDTLFIDEGFGSLDRDTLDIAVDALESLHSRGRKVAVITHVAAMIDRIAVQVRVEKLGGGHSVVKLTGGPVM
jgi:DNA repair protein SbcC/Rad50